MEIQIDPEFQAMIPPLAEEERRQLEENIIRDGCRDPLVVWPLPEFETENDDGEMVVVLWEDAQFRENEFGEFRVWNEVDLTEGDWPCILIDGHNRYEICTRLGIHFEITKIEFSSREEAADWIDANQLGRRNLHPDQMSLLRGRRYNRTKKSVGEHKGNQHTKMENHQNDGIPTAERLAQQHGVSKATIERDGQFAEAVEVLGLQAEVAAGAIDAPKQAIVQAARPIIEATRAHRRWEDEAARAPLAPPPEPPLPTKDDIQKAKAHVAHNSGENEWYTPSTYIESARAVLGVIDCDPASCELANRTVQASSYYTKETDGLSKRWFGNVWMNPPYAQPLMSQFAEAVSSKFDAGEIAAAIVLVNNATETAWFQRMLQSCSAACLVKSRIKFLGPNGNPGSPLQGQAILYFGKHVLDFSSEFAQYGKVLFNE
jgi:ParB family chromosome partitioning protein